MRPCYVARAGLELLRVQAILLPQPPKHLDLQACLQLTATVYFEKGLGSLVLMLLDGYQVLLRELRCNAPSEMSKRKVTSLPGSLCPVHEPLQEMTTEATSSASPLTRHLGHTQAAHPIPQQLQLCPNLSPKGSSPTVREQTS